MGSHPRNCRLKICSNTLIGARVTAIFDNEHGLYGVKYIAVSLNDDTDLAPINHKKVARIMKDMGLKGFTKRHRCSATSRKPGHRVMPDLVVRKFTADRPNHVYVGDITYLPCKGDKNMYLATVTDAIRASSLVMRSPSTCGYLWLSRLCLITAKSAEALLGQFSILIMAVCTPHRRLGTTAPNLGCVNPWARWELVSIMPWQSHLTPL